MDVTQQIPKVRTKQNEEVVIIHGSMLLRQHVNYSLHSPRTSNIRYMFYEYVGHELLAKDENTPHLQIRDTRISQKGPYSIT